ILPGNNLRVRTHQGGQVMAMQPQPGALSGVDAILRQEQDGSTEQIRPRTGAGHESQSGAKGAAAGSCRAHQGRELRARVQGDEAAIIADTADAAEIVIAAEARPACLVDQSTEDTVLATVGSGAVESGEMTAGEGAKEDLGNAASGRGPGKVLQQ